MKNLFLKAFLLLSTVSCYNSYSISQPKSPEQKLQDARNTGITQKLEVYAGSKIFDRLVGGVTGYINDWTNQKAVNASHLEKELQSINTDCCAIKAIADTSSKGSSSEVICKVLLRVLNDRRDEIKKALSDDEHQLEMYCSVLAILGNVSNK